MAHAGLHQVTIRALLDLHAGSQAGSDTGEEGEPVVHPQGTGPAARRPLERPSSPPPRHQACSAPSYRGFASDRRGGWSLWWDRSGWADPGFMESGPVTAKVAGSESAGVVKDHPVVTVAQMVAGHVGLDISCLDRLYLTGFVAKLQTPGGVVYFLHDHRGKPIASPALFERIGNKFRTDMTSWAQANQVPVITFKAGDRKADVMAPHLQAAADEGVSKVVAIGKAQEFASVWTARRRDTDPDRCPQFSFTREQRRVSVFYVYIWDERMGPGFIKICTYFPYPIKVWVNGHEWAKRQAIAAGIGFTELSNGFATCTDPAALQDICDRLARHDAGVRSNGGWPGSRCR